MQPSTIKINGLSDLIKVVNESSKAFNTDLLWYRGHIISDWKLRPSVYRDPAPIDGYESALTQDFRVRAASRSADCPPDDDPLGWLTLMRHHGLPTRLLDWTESILIAAYFAVEDGDRNCKPGAVWVLDPTTMNELRKNTVKPCRPPREACQLLAEDAFISVGSRADILAIRAKEISLRMMAQQSVYTIHGTPAPMDGLPGAGDYLRKYEIPLQAIGQLKEELLKVGISESVVYPDLDHLANDVRKTRVHRQSDAIPR